MNGSDDKDQIARILATSFWCAHVLHVRGTQAPADEVEAGTAAVTFSTDGALSPDASANSRFVLPKTNLFQNRIDFVQVATSTGSIVGVRKASLEQPLIHGHSVVFSQRNPPN